MSHEESRLYELSELCDLSGVTPRTVRYYIQQGLLPAPGQPGPGAKYGDGHVARLALIRQLQREHLPLSEIRGRLRTLDDGQVKTLLAVAAPGPARGSAVDYIRSVLAGSRTMTFTEPGTPPATAASSATVTPASGLPASPGVAAERSQWERIGLDPDVELHVRRPLSREQNRRVEQLLEQARRIFGGKDS